MPRPSTEEHTAAAAFVVAQLRAGHIDESVDFIEWYLDNYDSDLSHLLPAELEEEY